MAKKSDFTGVVGIDLGTTNSVMTALKEDGTFEILNNKDGNKLTPSFVWLEEREDGKIKFNVGDKAKEKMSESPENVLSSYKTHMGTDKVIKNIAGMDFNAQICSILALKYMKESAQASIGDRLFKSVITVPAYFNENQKSATRRAGIEAGMEVIGIVPEPTATALYYTRNTEIPEEGLMVMVYDIGGGTFDVSIVYVTEDNATVQAISGDHYLGGDDFDSVLALRVENLAGLYRKLDETQTEILVRRCEEAKRNMMIRYEELSNKNVKTATSGIIEQIKVGDLGSKEEFIAISLDEFLKITQQLVDRTIDCVEDAMNESLLTTEHIDEVILVGGSSRLVGVRKSLAKYFDGKFSEDYFDKYSVNPDLAISGGAAIYAQLIVDNVANTVTNPVTMPLGIKDNKGDMAVFLSSGSPMPAKVNKTFSTTFDGQREIEIDVYEGFSNKADNNVLIGSMTVEVPPNKKVGEFSAILTFKIDLDGLLSVTSISDKVTKLVINRTGEDVTKEMKEINKVEVKDKSGAKDKTEEKPEEGEALMNLDW